MIRWLLLSDFDVILNVVNDEAQVYTGVIPFDRWKEPYMPAEELRENIERGVTFYGWVELVRRLLVKRLFKLNIPL